MPEDADGNQYGVSRFTYPVLRGYGNWDVVPRIHKLRGEGK